MKLTLLILAFSCLVFASPSGNENGVDAPYPTLIHTWRASCPSGYDVAHASLPDEALVAVTNPVRDPDDDGWYYYCSPMCGVNNKTGRAKKNCIVIY